jgi:hypothetical protein
MTKTCKYCGVERDISEFYKSTRHTGGYLHKCKPCSREYNRRRYKEDPERHKRIQRRHHQNNPYAKRKTLLMYKYGITLEEYNRLKEQQGNLCAICGIDGSTIDREFDVDHSHKTGEVRGLLCSKCNKGLGLFNDDINLLEKSINYLKLREL